MPGDEIALQRNADNKNVSMFLFDRFPYPYTMEDAEKWVETHLNQYPVCNFVIDVNGGVAGVIEFKLGDDIHRKCTTLGYWLGEPYWGRGIMTEAVKLVTGYAFKNFDIIRMQAMVNDNNPASQRVLEKAGFAREGIFKSAIIKDGHIIDEHCFALLK